MFHFSLHIYLHLITYSSFLFPLLMSNCDFYQDLRELSMFVGKCLCIHFRNDIFVKDSLLTQKLHLHRWWSLFEYSIIQNQLAPPNALLIFCVFFKMKEVHNKSILNGSAFCSIRQCLYFFCPLIPLCNSPNNKRSWFIRHLSSFTLTNSLINANRFK